MQTSRTEAPETTIQSTTQFVDSGTIVSAHPTHDPTPLTNLHLSNANFYNQTLLDFLSKPHEMASFVWQTTDASFSNLKEITLLKDILLADDSMVKRLDYYRHIRADACIRIQANPSQISSGKILAYYMPFYGIKKYEEATLAMPRRVTQLPLCEFDLATDRSLEFEVSWHHPLAFFTVVAALNTTNSQQLGRLRFFTYTPLRGGLTVTFQVWGWLKRDSIVLANPTTQTYDLSLPATRNYMAKVSKLRQDGSLYEKEFKTIPLSEKEFSFVNQTRGFKPIIERRAVGPSNYIVPATSLRSATDANPVEKNSDTMSATAVTQAKKLVSQAGGAAVSWAVKKASEVAAGAILAAENPRAEKAPLLVLDRGSHDLCTVNQAVPSFTYAFQADSKLADAPALAFHSGDETAFAHLVSIPTYHATVTWSTATAAKTLLYSVGTSPKTLGYHEGSGHKQWSPYAAIAGMFAYWRGTFKFTVKIAKTRFHSGRLLLCWDANSGGSPPSHDETDVLPRVIIDLEQGNEWTFDIPYMNVNYFSKYSSDVSRIMLFVHTPLQVASSAAGTVDIIFECSMTDDAAFMYPTGLLFQTNDLPQHSTSNNARELITSSKQMDPTSVEALCVGDTCKSLLEYLKRAPNVTHGTPGHIFANWPFDDSLHHTILRRVATWYALHRGSLRYTVRLYSTGAETEPAYIRLGLPANPHDPYVSAHTGYVQFMTQHKTVSFEVPQMAVVPWRICTDQASGEPSSLYDFPVLDPKFPADSEWDYLVTAADDFRLALFTGINPVSL